MTNLNYSISINAPKRRVWDVMLNASTYRIWTEVFSKGSYYKGDWSKGSKMLFLAPNDNGTHMGMISVVEENRPYEYVLLKSIGEVKNDVEDTTSNEATAWAGVTESYTFNEEDTSTTLLVNISGNMPKQFEDMFNGMWPLALNKLKELCETEV
jgi:hypothetical protein